MKWNTPNKLTMARVVMVPFFILFMLTNIGGQAGHNYIACMIFIAASLTDTLDGYLARKNNEITVFGKFMDPLADKLLVCSAMICLTYLHRLSPVVTIIIVGRDFIISGFRLIAAEKGTVIAASYWGKVKTAVQMVTMVILIFDYRNVWAGFETFLVILATALTIISLCDYLVKNKSVLEEVH